MAEIRLQNLRHSYKPDPETEDDYALKSVDLVWKEGLAYALLGPSGSGKTTMLNILSGLLRPSEGQVLFDGRDVTRLDARERNIAQVFQFPVIYETMTVEENLAFPLRTRKVAPAKIAERVVFVAEELGLTALLRRRARALSAEQKQRISLGRGLVREDVAAILLDEPLTVIDPAEKMALRRTLKSVQLHLGVKLIYVTHDQHEAMTLADQVVVMNEGAVVQVGTPHDLFENPEHKFVGYFIGTPGMNFASCKLDDKALQVGKTQIKINAAAARVLAAERQDLFFGVRPDFLSVVKPQPGLTIPGTVASVENHGDEQIVSVSIGDDVMMEAAKRYVNEEFKRSTLSPDEQLAELRWYVNAALPLAGTKIKVLSDGIPVHKYDAEVLAKAFTEITGIEVVHDVVDEAGVVERIQTQMQSGENIYDAYINDSDLIGTHFRNNAVLNLSKYMTGAGAPYTSPTLDLEDFIGLDFVKDVNGDIYQLPAQQFANLYWFRQDWFEQPDLQARFRDKYGYELGVPINWSAYEDIADFFTNDVREIDGVRVYGHMDYGKKDPSLGWRFTDAWLSMAGAGDVGIPNGVPVDEWGIRVAGCSPVGASVARGGAANGPAAVYALQKYIDWMANYAPPEAQAMNFYEAGLVPNQGHIAQQIFWYTLFAESAAQPGVPVADEAGLPKWRMAPSPAGSYWEDGMKLGYQDVAAFTIMNTSPDAGKTAAWLYSQFVTSKSVSLERTLHGYTPIRESDINSEVMTELAPKLGGLVEFYRSPARVAWTPTGTNVPDYPKMAQLWWENVAAAVSGEMTSQQAMDRLAAQMDRVMQRLERAGMARCAPKLNEKRDAEYWFAQPGAPKPKLANEKPQGETVPYAQLIAAWEEGRVR